MSRPARDRRLRRRVGVRRPRKTLLVFVEGKRTEPEYFAALKRQPDVREVASVDIRVELRSAGSVPLTLVEMAVEARARSLREEGEVDEFWCVFDVEWPQNHPALQQALSLARENGIHVAVSNPNFELWLVLHFQDWAGWLDNNAARRLRRNLDGATHKGVNGDLYMPRRVDAWRRAVGLDVTHAGNGIGFPNNNPSSGMHKLLASITAGS